MLLFGMLHTAMELSDVCRSRLPLKRKGTRGKKEKKKRVGKTMSADHVSPCCNGHGGRVRGLHLYVELLMTAPEMRNPLNNP